MKRIKKVNALSVGKTLGSIYALMGLLFGGVLTIFALIGSSLNSQNNFGGIFLGVFAVILIPLFYGILGFVFGVIFGWFYNLGAKFGGGIRVEVTDDTSQPQV